MRRWVLWSMAFAVAALAGCTSVAPLPGGTRSYLDELTLAGRLSVRYPVQDKTQSVQGKFLWSQRRDGTDIDIYSPLGQTLARIRIVPGRATLEQSGGVRREASSAEQLTEDALGWPLPVDGMRYWLQGFVREAGGRLLAATPEGPERLESEGWRLSYPSWQASGQVAVPKRIDAQLGEIALRFVIDDWREGR